MPVLYTADHEWIDTSDAAAATVGITVHAQDALGDVVFVDLPSVGKTFKKGDVAGVVESVKAAANPLHAGRRRIVAVNEALRRSVARQQRPARQRLVLRVRISDPSETAR